MKSPQSAPRIEDNRPKPALADCVFYHTMDLPSGMVCGPWDLRGQEATYTGSVDVAGKSVMEFGPASGFFTAYLESCGADVLCIEAKEAGEMKYLPHHELDVASHENSREKFLKRLVNSWWFVHHELDLRSRVAYGDVATVPARFPAVDIAFLGAILLHCPSPADVLDQACAVARTVIVTDMASLPSTEDSLLRFNPSGGKDNPGYWWDISPGFVTNYLRLRGFASVDVSFHMQKHHPLNDMSMPPVDSPMFTVVGTR